MDVHFMIVHPENYIQQTADSGAAIMNVHYEACIHLHRTLQAIRSAGMKAGVTLNPSTPVNVLEDIIGDIDIVQLMSVNPGFGGQEFIHSQLSKISTVRKMIQDRNLKTQVSVDGGVNFSNAADVIKAGANILVAGSAIFKAEDVKKTINDLKNLSL